MFFMSSSVIPVKKWQKMIFSLRWRYTFVDSPFGDVIQSTVCLTVQLLFCWLPNTWLGQDILISFFSWWFLFAVVRIQKRQFATIIWERFNGTNDTCLMFSFVRLSHSVYSWECLHNEILSSPSLEYHSFFSVDKWIFNCSHSCTIHSINIPVSCHLLSLVVPFRQSWMIGFLVRQHHLFCFICLPENNCICKHNEMATKSRMISVPCSEWKNESVESPWWSDWTKEQMNGIWMNHHNSVCLNLI